MKIKFTISLVSTNLAYNPFADQGSYETQMDIENPYFTAETFNAIPSYHSAPSIHFFYSPTFTLRYFLEPFVDDITIRDYNIISRDNALIGESYEIMIDAKLNKNLVQQERDTLQEKISQHLFYFHNVYDYEVELKPFQISKPMIKSSGESQWQIDSFLMRQIANNYSVRKSMIKTPITNMEAIYWLNSLEQYELYQYDFLYDEKRNSSFDCDNPIQLLAAAIDKNEKLRHEILGIGTSAGRCKINSKEIFIVYPHPKLAYCFNTLELKKYIAETLIATPVNHSNTVSHTFFKDSVSEKKDHEKKQLSVTQIIPKSAM